MSKREVKFYLCVHAPCSFKTDKRKAIYTHLVRTHNERKEDYECEYCSSMFELDTEIERHLHVHHPQQPFTYTCVSRIEKVINNCAKLGNEFRRSQILVKSAETENSISPIASIEKKNTPPKNDCPSPISKPPYLKPNISMRTRASVNESLNNIAKLPKYTNVDDELALLTNPDMIVDEDIADDEFAGVDAYDDVEMEEVEIDTDEESPTYISKPSGLKIKLSLKKPPTTDTRDVSRERSNSPPILEPNIMPAEEEIDPLELPDDTPPDIVRSHHVSGTAQVRVKDSKYYDKLEVYHHTDEFGRRCCPFCDYKTSKNTIRVHLSGIHKIHFVKCSLCDYKAAFPHQITQHGIKFHKTTNLNVIQLSKESRDKTIAQLKKLGNVSAISSNQNESMNISKPAAVIETGSEIIDDEDFNSEESYPTSADENEPSVSQADDRIFKPPKCQTSKTDYYSIRVENGVYLYSCNLCTFQTPVRATIYTHKYRHEEKSYRCGYCDFMSAPRSNVVHHCRVKHKNAPVNVVESDFVDDTPAADLVDTNKNGTRKPETKAVEVKSEPAEAVKREYGNNITATVTSYEPRDNILANRKTEKSHQMIIKVPEFKRSITSVSFETSQSPEEAKRLKVEPDASGVEYKLSLNKLYRINPTGSPKFMCALCSYACDTHPKMKHHLYRHRPQKYKCPYCDHRKYPRSYVVRHVRDTHRNKPVRVIDLSKGNEPEDIAEYMSEGVEDSRLKDTAEHFDTHGAGNLFIGQTTIKQEPETETFQAGKRDVTTTGGVDDSNTEQNEEVNALKNFAQKLNLRSVLTTDLNDDIFMKSPDVSTNFSDAMYTSSPLIESFINGNYQNTSTPKLSSKNFEKKKSLKDYRVNYGHGPRYICNKCGYGTENYKTIHNHMYRHESQRYQCPYCGYRRSPKSFVENHIREVHKGHPVIVTELNIEQEMSDVPIGSPRQCVTLKRKDPPLEQLPITPPTVPASAKIMKVDETTEMKVPVKWPAPKPISHINLGQTPTPTTPKLKIIFKPNTTDRNVAQTPELLTSLTRPVQPSAPQNDAPTLKTQSLIATNTSPIPQANTPVNPLRFVERNRTTFKTMYKCVFDPETCNHISKDKSKMKQHLFMHVEYKPWTCDFCDMTASQSSHIKNHVRTEHPGTVETSFKYKRHNYLEKHIEGFLTKGLFTVPVNEYRAIMDMKGNTKSSKQPTFSRDEEGNLLCPYCSYRTKSGGMTDHVKMKHMQPRFKCHWCDYRAFYRSEIRKHHRKEKTHSGFEFKTQELDLVQVMEGYKEKEDSTAFGDTSASTASDIHLDASRYLDDEDEDDDDDDEDRNSECSSSEGSSMGDYQQGYVEYTTEQLSELCTNRQTKCELTVAIENDTETALDVANKHALLGALNTEIGPDGSMKIVPKHRNENVEATIENVTKESEFKCGYCSFSAALRVKVKMHCSKKHVDEEVKVIDPSIDHSMKQDPPDTQQDNLDLDADDWKGTKFEQDLRRAGISKLNLASLFPHSKRFQKSDINDEQLDTKVQNENQDAEFKKPFEPVSKIKSHERKLETTEKKDNVTTELEKQDSTISIKEVDKISIDQHNGTHKVTSKSNGCSVNNNNQKPSIMISNIRSLNHGKIYETYVGYCTEQANSEDMTTARTEQIEKIPNKSQSEKHETTFPHTSVFIPEEKVSEKFDSAKQTGTGCEELHCAVEQTDNTEEPIESRNEPNIKESDHDIADIDNEEISEIDNGHAKDVTNDATPYNSEDPIIDEANGSHIKEVPVNIEEVSEGTQQDSSKTTQNKMISKAVHELQENSTGIWKSHHTENVHVVNGHQFATDGTIKDIYEIKHKEDTLHENFADNSKESNNDNDRNADEVSYESDVFKMDGTSEKVVEMKLKSVAGDQNKHRISAIIDIPTNNGATCAIKDICQDT